MGADGRLGKIGMLCRTGKAPITHHGAKPGNVLLLTKPLGVGVITTAVKADMVDKEVLERVYRQMATLNKWARDVLVNYTVHSCTDVTGFALLGHNFEMAQGSGCTLHIQTGNLPYHPETLELTRMGLIPAGAYRNQEYAQSGVHVADTIERALEDLCYDPQTSGGLLAALPAEQADTCFAQLKAAGVDAARIGYVTESQDFAVYLEN